MLYRNTDLNSVSASVENLLVFYHPNFKAYQGKSNVCFLDTLPDLCPNLIW